MAKLIYMAITSVDGFIEDVDGDFGWSMPDPELHQLYNDLERDIGTHLYGRRMYETMAVWQDMGGDDDPPVERDYAEVWRGLEMVVFSSTLDEVWTPRTRLERRFDPDAVRALKQAAAKDLSISGPTVAGAAFRAGLVDEVRLFAFPVAVGGGKPALPRDMRLDLELLDQGRWPGGVVHAHYAVR